jgi:8-hydroxy-5-deazaflavin:NADPH oxidoreductase
VLKECINGTWLIRAYNHNLEVLVYIANPLDFLKGILPLLFIINTNSLAEEIQKKFQQLKVEKALNTMWCGKMVNPVLINGGDITKS